ncbi:MAG: transcriptional regulator/antitoxin, MazE [Rhodospirillales bacterium]|nr:transcriptional regulator/antitoxin, MazE [Rhodospirillales bacterium]
MDLGRGGQIGEALQVVSVIRDAPSMRLCVKVQVAKWGNGLAVRLPAAFVEALGLKEGEDIEIDVADARGFGRPIVPSTAASSSRFQRQ